jgi:hypothetical protein
MMTREKLRRYGVPESTVDALLAELTQDIDRESMRLAAQTLKELQAGMPKDARAAVYTSLMALTPDIAARKAECSRRTVSRAIESGELRAAKGSTGMVLIERASFDVWFRARTPDPSAPELPNVPIMPDIQSGCK